MAKFGLSFRTLLACGAIVVSLVSVPQLHAQGGAGGGRGFGGGQAGTPEERAQAQLTQLTQQLTLTPAQVEKVKPILVKQYTDQTALMASAQAGGDMTAMRTQMTALTENTQKAITALLTEEQKVAYQKLLEQQAQRRGGMGGPGGGGAGAGAPPQQ